MPGGPGRGIVEAACVVYDPKIAASQPKLSQSLYPKSPILKQHADLPSRKIDQNVLTAHSAAFPHLPLLSSPLQSPPTSLIHSIPPLHPSRSRFPQILASPYPLPVQQSVSTHCLKPLARIWRTLGNRRRSWRKNKCALCALGPR